MKKTGEKLALDCPAAYRIEVQGYLDEKWSDWFDNMAIVPLVDEEGVYVTSLTGTVIDQAALHGMLRKLYDLGLPVLSINPPDRNRSEGQHRNATIV